ncbi:DUF3040 domain-containing protein [Nonomuraea terrae]|uniref:DUF3040 domain-containing protein n=1 Tax=Nonomuraea terrae TaxID=2530383 RepID=A0A4R4XLJ4_9ACTN|nr:DUF3040 domain-containing protein [Nonomuraea terrae]
MRGRPGTRVMRPRIGGKGVRERRGRSRLLSATLSWRPTSSTGPARRSGTDAQARAAPRTTNERNRERIQVIAMRLSKGEQRALEEIEERLAFEDPDLDALLARTYQGEPPPPKEWRGPRTVPGYVWRVTVLIGVCVFLIVVGLLLTTPG